jgi:ATP-dependent DNA helicase RecQ
MGVDKQDVEMVIHYEISDSLENYVQEAGRAGRSEDIQAGCYVLFDPDDLGKHFTLLNHTRLNKKEIEQIWRGIRRLTAHRSQITRSALEIAKAAGWDREMDQLENRVTAAVAALEDGGYVRRGQNAPRIFANSFRERDVNVANEMVRRSPYFSEKDREHAIRIIQRIVKEDETRVDHLAEVLAIPKEAVVRVLNLLRQAGIIGDAKDLTAFLDLSPDGHPAGRFTRYARLEKELLGILAAGRGTVFLKQVNEALADAGVEDTSVDAIKDILLYWETRSIIHKSRTDRALHAYEIRFRVEPEALVQQMGRRLELAGRIADYLAAKRESEPADPARPKSRLLEFSLLELKAACEKQPGLTGEPFELSDYEEALLYLNAISALKLEGGFLILYMPLTLERLEADNRPYTNADYRKLETHYAHKVQQIHIVGEYAKKMLSNYQDALSFVDDYFTLDYGAFLKKYFPGRQGEIKRPLLPEKFKELFGNLSTEQLKIINDNVSGKILVMAGPGSGKTRVLVHKVASLLLLEDIKPEQFLMLTFSRAAALEFKERLWGLVRGLVHYMDIHTYHGYCFHLLGRVGTLEKSDGIIRVGLEAVRSGTIPEEKIAAKSVLVVDEFQDINAEEFALLEELIRVAGDIRVIVVGDADQNIYEFRGASATHMAGFADLYRAIRYELRTNFRSRQNLVAFANGFLSGIGSRLPKGEIVAHTTENGTIRLVRHGAPHLVAPLVADVKRLRLQGTTAVLTPTNDEARLVENGLRKVGVVSRLILSAEGFCLADLLEIRHFTDQLLRDTPGETGRIPGEVWDAAWETTETVFAGSDKLWLCAAVAGQFDKSYPKKYLTEWGNYLQEVRFEDFYYPEERTVLVSTMHKAKGKEFDHVFLLLDGYPMRDDAARRAVYVALTRAKRTLTIHTNGSAFDHLEADNLEREHDSRVHTPSNEISLSLTHEDMYLGGFKHPKVAVAVNGLYSGQSLAPGHDGRPLVRLPNGCSLRFSHGFEEKLAGYRQAGYMITGVTVHFIVYWRDVEEDREYKVVLPRVTLEKQLTVS